ncbi:hypothetical protein CBER1_06017 [Cercospora berteroae]|uniref:Zinc finger H2C2-type histone UAS binding domain-containing protein n=1 Tax=Cercospora berteroae TaxID=357750 RepID=A0A2S6C4R2_9PEZI|nr:hypothetical protein CBER1_06017 [Cercospora berteroae]
MPAMLDDPTSPAIYRVSGQPPFPEPYGPLPYEITPKQVTLRDRTTIATIVPFSSPGQVPPHLTAYLCELLNREIEKGDTYPMMDGLALSAFAPYWFANFGAIMVMGDISSPEEITRMEERGVDWAKLCLGSFYVKPNYPGRSSHVCNGGFLVTDAARNRGVGRLMGEVYLEWAPKLGYTYSVFNLVYETNVASLRIWDALGFKRIGRVKGCGNLKSYPDAMIDAIIFGRELGGENEEYQSEERFDKIRYYLKSGAYPAGSDRAEKSRLRSAATHYRLIPGANGEDDKLMLKGKEVVSDPHKQYEIARAMHAQTHGGINKTTAGIAEKYHWVRIKETVSAAIRNCTECKESSGPKNPGIMPPTTGRRGPVPGSTKSSSSSSRQVVTASPDSPMANAIVGASSAQTGRAEQSLSRSHSDDQQLSQQLGQNLLQQSAPTARMGGIGDYHDGAHTNYGDIGPVDPQLMWQTGSDDTHMQLDGDDKTGVAEDEDSRLREVLGAHAMAGEISSFLGEDPQRQSGR